MKSAQDKEIDQSFVPAACNAYDASIVNCHEVDGSPRECSLDHGHVSLWPVELDEALREFQTAVSGIESAVGLADDLRGSLQVLVSVFANLEHAEYRLIAALRLRVQRGTIRCRAGEHESLASCRILSAQPPLLVHGGREVLDGKILPDTAFSAIRHFFFSFCNSSSNKALPSSLAKLYLKRRRKVFSRDLILLSSLTSVALA